MRLIELRPMIWTREMQATIDFYTGKLAFTCLEYDEEAGWAELMRDDVYIMLAFPNEHVPFEKPAFTGSFYINTEDVNALWDDLKDKAEICYKIDTFDYGMRDFAIYDNNGYILQFGQPADQVS